MRSWVVAALLLSTLASGCSDGGSGGPQDDQAASEESAGGQDGTGGSALLPGGSVQSAAPGGPEGLEVPEGEEGGAAPGVDASKAPWWFLPVETSDEGSTAGFLWTVPDRGLFPNPDFDDMPTLSFEAGFVGAEEAGLEKALVQHFRLADGEARLVSTWSWAPTAYRYQYGGTVAAAAQETTPSFDPLLGRLSIQDLAPGDQLGIVVSAQGGSGEVGWAFRLLDHVVDYSEDEPSATAGDLVANLTALGTGAQLAPHALADGWSFDLYVAFSSIDAYVAGVSNYAIELWSLPQPHTATVPGGVLPGGPFVQSLALLMAGGPTEGWGLANVYASPDGGAVAVESTVSCFGHEAPVTEVEPGANPAQYGYVFALAAGDGSGGCTVDATVDMASPAGGFILGERIALGATLEDLVGLPSWVIEATGAYPVARVAGGDLVLETAAGPVTLVGMAPPPALF